MAVALERFGMSRHVIALPDPEERRLRLILVGNMELRLTKMCERTLKDSAVNRTLQVIGEAAEFLDVDADGRVGIIDTSLALVGLSAPA